MKPVLLFFSLLLLLIPPLASVHLRQLFQHVQEQELARQVDRQLDSPFDFHEKQIVSHAEIPSFRFKTISQFNKKKISSSIFASSLSSSPSSSSPPSSSSLSSSSSKTSSSDSSSSSSLLILEKLWGKPGVESFLKKTIKICKDLPPHLCEVKRKEEGGGKRRKEEGAGRKEGGGFGRRREGGSKRVGLMRFKEKEGELDSVMRLFSNQKPGESERTADLTTLQQDDHSHSANKPEENQGSLKQNGTLQKNNETSTEISSSKHKRMQSKKMTILGHTKVNKNKTVEAASNQKENGLQASTTHLTLKNGTQVSNLKTDQAQENHEYGQDNLKLEDEGNNNEIIEKEERLERGLKLVSKERLEDEIIPIIKQQLINTEKAKKLEDPSSSLKVDPEEVPKDNIEEQDIEKDVKLEKQMGNVVPNEISQGSSPKLENDSSKKATNNNTDSPPIKFANDSGTTDKLEDFEELERKGSETNEIPDNNEENSEQVDDDKKQNTTENTNENNSNYEAATRIRMHQEKENSTIMEDEKNETKLFTNEPSSPPTSSSSSSSSLEKESESPTPKEISIDIESSSSLLSSSALPSSSLSSSSSSLTQQPPSSIKDEISSPSSSSDSFLSPSDGNETVLTLPPTQLSSLNMPAPFPQDDSPSSISFSPSEGLSEEDNSYLLDDMSTSSSPSSTSSFVSPSSSSSPSSTSSFVSPSSSSTPSLLSQSLGSSFSIFSAEGIPEGELEEKSVFIKSDKANLNENLFLD